MGCLSVPITHKYKFDIMIRRSLQTTHPINDRVTVTPTNTVIIFYHCSTWKLETQLIDSPFTSYHTAITCNITCIEGVIMPLCKKIPLDRYMRWCQRRHVFTNAHHSDHIIPPSDATWAHVFPSLPTGVRSTSTPVSISTRKHSASPARAVHATHHHMQSHHFNTITKSCRIQLYIQQIHLTTYNHIIQSHHIRAIISYYMQSHHM